jgi:hypothetical protein
MKNLIYYPGFEVENHDWLKFALLYIEQLNPIIPIAGDAHLSPLYERLLGDTDLIAVHRPEYSEGQKATLDAIEAVERILRNPRNYSWNFRHDHAASVWRHPGWHNHLLFRDKYTAEWEHFCQSHRFCTEADEGIYLSRDLAHIYMTLLAQVIADRRGVSPITDHPNLYRFAVFARKAATRTKDNLQIAQAVLQVQLPSNVNEIGFQEIIAFRNGRGYKSRLRAFHTQLDAFFDGIENGTSPESFVSSFDRIWGEFVGEVVTLGLGAMAIGLGTWILARNPSTTTEEYLKDVVVGGASLLVGTTLGFRNAWNNTRTARYTRKYLADLTQLRPRSVVRHSPRRLK